jgi:hypothetical protein
MTFRTRYAPRPTRRRARRDDTRRSILLTFTFVAAIAVALSLVASLFIANYYTDHGAPVASVNGEAISKDAVRNRVALNIARDKRQVQDYLVLRNQGKITPDEYASLAQGPTADETSSTLYSDALKQLQTEATLRQYASKHGISVTDQQIQDQMKTDSTIPELRHIMVIASATTPTPPASAKTTQDVNAARARMDSYLAELKSGKKWTDVATDSNDNSGGATTDLGLSTRDGVNLDPDITAAIFNLAKPNDVTDVFHGEDGIFRMATVTSIVPPYYDAGWVTAIGGDYQSYARSEAIQKAVKTAVEKQYIDTPTVQRNVLEIGVQQGYGQPGGGDEVKVSFMIFAPNHSTSGASSVAASDPAWADAKSRAEAAVATLRADPSKFAAMARDTNQNDDVDFSSGGGSLPWIPADIFGAQTAGGQTGLTMPGVQLAVFAPNLKPDTILDPIQETARGYVVVKFEGRRPAPLQRIADAQLTIASGSDFATVAREASEAPNAPDGGNLGWVSRYMLTPDQESAVFAAPVGGVSRMVTANAYWIYKVVGEETRLPDAATAAKLRKVVFQSWLTQLQSNTNVWTDQAALTAITPPSPTP